ncbi:MAG: aminopeptidase P N-terminal domain-containing protein [Gammaproteobacteria bacterium]|nr:aminopeptidase P N-terminal domain-containing protein [SAR86 cluster bacterium]
MTNAITNIYKSRRDNVAKSLENDSCLIINSSSNVIRNNDTTFPFRQSSNFFYLTGFDEPDSILLVHNDGKSIFFCREKDPNLEKWDGFMYGVQGAKENFMFDEVYSVGEAEDLIPEIIKGNSAVYSLIGKDLAFDKTLISMINNANKKERHQANIDLKNYSNVIGKMRLVKGGEEIDLMRKSCQIAAHSHKEVISNVKVGMNEFDIESMYLNEFRRRGSRYPSYTPIVASGKNACTLHYIDNNNSINDGDLVLVDAGCEYGMYASDITRTFPINGRYSAEQRAVYDVVLEAHNKSCEAVKIGNSCLEPQRVSERVISEGLKDLGFLDQSMDEILEKQLFREFYYHKIGHWLGLDVHDDCPYSIEGSNVIFQENMVMTIEPGIYINDSAPIDKKWKGIGIRIENDIRATNSGYENLTSEAPFDADEIEALMKN